jgi:hypothetical protein
MESLSNFTQTLPPMWKWEALFTPPAAPHDREWRAWLGQAQQAEEQATLAYWARRRSSADETPLA